MEQPTGGTERSGVLPEGTTLDDQIAQVRDALETAGLHTWELSAGIVNVYSAPVTGDWGDPEPTDATYLYTVTVTKTP